MERSFMKINHVAIYVNDIENAKDFFIKYFNAKSNELYNNKSTNFKSYFLSFEDNTKLELMNKADLQNSGNNADRLGYAHIAFSVGSKENVNKLTHRLKNDGYSVLSDPRTTGDGYYESCILAIEDNIIEITI